MSAVIASALSGCSSPPRNFDAVRAYYDYDFTAARQALRTDATTEDDDQLVLNNVRLGMAALADGDLPEAESALGKAFEFLSTAGLNKDRTVAAVLDHEGKRIWKGEPFEQALTYHYTATLYAVMGDWENARAAATNSLFRLTDFGRDQNPEKLTRTAAKDEEYLETGYTAVDTDFALGFLMQAIGADLSGLGGADVQYDAAVQINPELQSLVDVLKSREYDTLLVVDYGEGPAKVAYGPDEALVKFVPQERIRRGDKSGNLVVFADNLRIVSAGPVCDVDQMAVDHRWNNLEDIRRAKSIIGEVLLAGGVISTAYGADRHDAGAALGGIAAMVTGLLLKSGAKGDTRYCEFMPQLIYLVPLKLGATADLRLSLRGDDAATLNLPAFEPGTRGKPRVAYLRLLGGESREPGWLLSEQLLYGNDHAGVPEGNRGFPYILGGSDVSTPARKTLEAYQANGYLTDYTLSELRALYDAEGIVIGSGMENRPDVSRDPSFEHILEGGTGLFTPAPYTMGYKRLMYSAHPPYEPQSELVRRAAESIRAVSEGPVVE